MCQIACAMQLLEWTNDLVLLSILHFLVKKFERTIIFISLKTS